MARKKKIKKAARRNWTDIVRRFSDQKGRRKSFTLSGATVAQVTRIRLIERFPKLGVRTEGAVLILEK